MNLIGHCEEMNYMWMVSTVIPILLMLNAMNEHFKKNRSRSEIKSHHYIISFDPDDKSECGLTGEKVQELCLNLAQKIFPGYQALIVTHTDGHNGSGNIHTHIVINSVRKEAVRRQSYMDKPHEEIAGYKHRSTIISKRKLWICASRRDFIRLIFSLRLKLK